MIEQHVIKYSININSYHFMHPWEGKVQGKTVDGQSQQAVNSQLTGLEKQGQAALETGSPPGWGACHVWGRLEHLISSAWPFRDISPDSILPEPLTYLHLFPCPFQGSPTTLYFLGCPIPRSLYLFNHLQAGTITLFNSYLLSTCSMPGNGGNGRFWVHGPSLCDHLSGLASQVGSWFEENAAFINGHSVSLGVWQSVTLTIVERVIEWM